GEGGAAGFIGDAKPIPYTRPQIAAAYVLAAQMMGMRYAYLEGGSGTTTPVPRSVISYVKKFANIKIIVGGGIRNKETAKDIVAAGADIIVTGTITEGIDNTELENRLKEIINGVKEGVKLRNMKSHANF
ncbi:MAG: geranylgeranylglyceryl/heptaprenylglyceryl phosphate synthase, partial [Nitrososphaeria archaeon]